jgi:hypothetical protein
VRSINLWPGLHSFSDAVTAVGKSQRREVHSGVSAPQSGVPLPSRNDRLPRSEQAWPARVWWLGVHGGAGESTLAALAEGTRPAGHAWPIPVTPGTTHHVALVARTHYAGLTAAQHAATEWASHSVGDGVQLAGLVLIADAPGRLPKPLRDLENVIGGGVPHVWHLPWVDAWRFGPVSVSDSLPREFRDLFAALSLAPNTSVYT